MTHHAGNSSPPNDEPQQSSTTEVARDEATEVARTAAQGGGQVAGTAGEQAGRVASETAQQARNLFAEGKNQVAGQAKDGQRKAASGLHALADQLDRMAEKSDGQGMAPELARQASERTRTVASWLEEREPGDLVVEVRRFARRKPGIFLAGAALAGVVVGRLTRGAIDANSSSSDADGAEAATGARPGQAATPPMPHAVNPAYQSVPAPDYTGQPTQPGYATPPVPPPAPGYSAPQTAVPDYAQPGQRSGPVPR